MEVHTIARHTCFSFCFALLAALALSALASTAFADNLLRNPGFELGDREWSLAGHFWYESPKGSGLSVFHVDDAVAHTGKHSLRLIGSDNRGVGLQRASGTPGVEYRASAWLKTKGLGAVEAGFDVGLLGDTGQWITGVAPTPLTGDNDWTLLSITFTPPPLTKYLQLHVFTRAPNRGIVWFDDLVLEPVLPPAPVDALSLKPSAAADVLLDWSAYRRAPDVKSFRVYSSPSPFANVADAKLLAEVTPDVSTYTAPAAREAFFAVTAVGEKGREATAVRSLSLLALQPSQPVPPNCLWADDLTSSRHVFLTSHTETGPGGGRLAWRKTREWFPLSDARRVTSAGGWDMPRCDKPGATLTISFTGLKLLAYAPGSTEFGLIEVSLDGAKPHDVDLCADWAPMRQVALADCETSGPHTVVVRLPGRKSERSSGTAAQFDLFQVGDEGYAPEGTVVSEPLVCAPSSGFRWSRLRYAAGRPAGTTLAVDVLDGAGNVLLADAHDGADLTALRSPILQLRARLTSPDGRRTPALAFWHVEYTQARPNASGLVLDALTGKPIPGAKLTFRDHEASAAAPGYLTSRPGSTAPVLYPSSTLGHRLTAWPVSAMDSIFEDTPPPASPPHLALSLEAAANEYEPAQLCLRPSEDLGRLRVVASDLWSSHFTIPAANLRTFFVGYVPVPRNTDQVPDAEHSRVAPAYFPDPLLADDDCELSAGRTQPIWLTVKVPRDAPPGHYTGALRLETAYGVVPVPVTLTVFPFALTDESHVWFGHGGSGWNQVVSRYSTTDTEAERWRLIRMAMRNRADHRENVMYLDGSVFDMCHVVRTAAGAYRYDFAELDQWIAAVRETYPHGKFLIEGACFANRDGWDTKEIFFGGCNVFTESGEADPAHSLPRISADSDQFKTFARPFFAALQDHLAALGMLDKFYTRIQDEPIDPCRDAYLRLAAFVHDCAPRLKRFESIQTLGLAGSLEIMNPQLDWFDRNHDYFMKSRRPGLMIWFYTCGMPRGLYPSRFIDYPLLKHRIINWMSYRLGAEGYDRWAWAEWGDDPYDHSSDLAPGDNHVVYPDPRRREMLSSLRYEMMRESMEDYEYLWTLGDRLGKTAAALGAREGEFDASQRPMELAALAVTSGTVYERDSVRLLALRRQIASEIAAAGTSPRVVFQTSPSSADPIPPGPVTVSGIVEKGASVSVNGKPVKVAPDGRFRATVAVSISTPRLTVRVTLGKSSRDFVRDFRVVDVAADQARQRAAIEPLLAPLQAAKPLGPRYQAFMAEMALLQSKGQLTLALALAAKVSQLNAMRFRDDERGAVIVPTVFADRSGFLLKNDRLSAILWDQGARIIDLRIDGLPLLAQGGLTRPVTPGTWTDIGGYEDAGTTLFAENMTDWKLDLRSDTEAEVAVVCTRDLPGGIHLERTVSLRQGETRLRLDYSATNTSAARASFTWRAHTEFGLGAGPAGDRFLVATADKLSPDAFDGAKPGELRLSLNGRYAGAFDPTARAAVAHLLPPDAKQVTVWIAADLYTVEPWIFRTLDAGETYRFTTYLAAAAPVSTPDEAARAFQP